MPKPPAHQTYRQLVEDIARFYEDAKRSQVRFAWETGRRIVEVEQDGAVRAEYGEGLIPRLSKDLTRRHGAGFSVTNLKDIRKFFLANQKSRPAGFLPLTSQLQLLRVKDVRVRQSLQRRAMKEVLGKYEIRRLVGEANAAGGTPGGPGKPFPPLRRPTDLRLHTYRKSGADIDCGFFVYYPASRGELGGAMITDEPAYTYAATVERVVDGDTLAVVIEVGFGIKLREKLRLRGVDCPELGTPAGEKAKKFVEKVLPAGSRIVLRSHKGGADKYGRFVADVFHSGGDPRRNVPSPRGEQQRARDAGYPDPQAIISGGVYLNQQLLDEGLAVRMGE